MKNYLPPRSLTLVNQLLASVTPKQTASARLRIGEPNAQTTEAVSSIILEHAALFARYPSVIGDPACIRSLQNWLLRRYRVSVPEEALAIANGSREILYTLAHLVVGCSDISQPVIAIPEPFYPTYFGAVIAAGAEPVGIPCPVDRMPDFSVLSDQQKKRLCAIYVCNPSNPTGRVATEAEQRTWLDLAEQNDAVVIADECYSEIWFARSPTSFLQLDPALDRCIIVNSLSKRSGVPGLRVGFCALGKLWREPFATLRSYGAPQVPTPLQKAAAWLWSDEQHVAVNQQRLAKNLDLACSFFSTWPDFVTPEAGMFLWLPVGDGEAMTIKLYREFGLQVLPGRYMTISGLYQQTDQPTLADPYIRVAFVDDYPSLQTAFGQIVQANQTLTSVARG